MWYLAIWNLKHWYYFITIMTLQVHVPHGILRQNKIMEKEGLTRVTLPSHALLEPGMTEEAHNLISEGGLLKAFASTQCSKCWHTGTGTANFCSALFYGMLYPKTYLKFSEAPQSNENLVKPMQKWIVLPFQTKSGKLKHLKQLQKIELAMATAQKCSAMQSYYFNSLINSL